MNILQMYMLIAGFFAAAIALTIFFVVRMNNRGYIFMIKKNGDFGIFRGNIGKAPSVKVKDIEYFYTEETIFSCSGKKAIFVKEGAPGALIPALKDKTLKWDFISSDSIVAIMNDEHVKEVARAGQDKMNARDILVLIGIGVSIVVGLITLAKVYGIVKGDAPVK